MSRQQRRKILRDAKTDPAIGQKATRQVLATVEAGRIMTQVCGAADDRLPARILCMFDRLMTEATQLLYQATPDARAQVADMTRQAIAAIRAELDAEQGLVLSHLDVAEMVTTELDSTLEALSFHNWLRASDIDTELAGRRVTHEQRPGLLEAWRATYPTPEQQRAQLAALIKGRVA